MADHRRPKDMWRAGDVPATPGSTSAAQRKSSGRKRLFLSALVFAALVGVVIGLIMFIRPDPKVVFLSIPVTQYERDWPVNPWAQQDAEALVKHFPDGKVLFQSQERALILRELKQLGDRSRKEDKGRPVVVHFCANAIVRDGAVYALPGDARPGEPRTWLRMDEILDLIRNVEGNRLLLLDLRPVVDARLGGLVNDLSETLRVRLDELEKSGNLPFAVICANGPGTQAYGSRELRRGLFGWFLDRGLAGHADGWNESREQNKRVSALELMDFAGNHTGQATGLLNLPDMAPARFGSTTDFVVLPVPQKEPGAAPPIEAAAEYPQWLSLTWKKRDDWREDGSFLRLQRTYRHLETALLRAESLWLGGFDAVRAEKDLADELRETIVIKQKYPEPIPPRRSVAQVEKAGIKDLADTQKALANVVKAIRSSPEPKKEDAAEFNKHLDAFKEKPPDRDAATSILFAAALDRPEPSIEQLKLIDRAAGILNLPRHAELLMLRFVTELDPKRRQLWEPETISRILRTAQKAEQAVAIDGRCLPWLRKDIQETDALRRQAMEKLLKGVEDDRQQARAVLDVCWNRYGDIAGAGRALENAWKILDEARLFLIAWSGFESPDPRIEVELNKLWSEAIEKCREMLALLKPPAQPFLPSTALVTNRVSEMRNTLAKISKLIRPPHNASHYDLQRWLAWPLWTSQEREDLCERLRQTGHPLIEKVVRTGPEKPHPLAKTFANAAHNDPTVAIRARRAIDVLTLTGDPELDKLERQFAALQLPYDTRQVAELGQAIETRWRVHLPARYRQAKDLTEQAIIGWAIHPFDLSAIPGANETFKRDAAADCFLKAQKDYVTWLVTNRDQEDARFYAKMEYKAAVDLADRLDQLGRDQLKWARE